MEFLDAITPYLTTDNATILVTALGSFGIIGPKILFWNKVVIEAVEYFQELPDDNTLLVQDLETKGKKTLAKALKKKMDAIEVS